MRIKVGELWLGLAEAMGHQISMAALSMMLDAVSDLPEAKVVSTLKNWMRGPNGRRFPLPADIREACGAAVDDKFMAIDATSRIMDAVNWFGYQQLTAARAYIGELGWMAVERIGGWSYLCENLGTKHLPKTTAHAQIRDVCETLVKMANAGRLGVPPDLPAIPASREEAKQLLNMVTKMIDSKDPDKGGKP